MFYATFIPDRCVNGDEVSIVCNEFTQIETDGHANDTTTDSDHQSIVAAVVQADWKTLRHVIQGIKGQGEVHQFHWIETKIMLTDIFTKDSAKCNLIKSVLEEGNVKVAIEKEGRKHQRRL